ncbi:MAG: ThiF family adenylyltransferase [Methanosarcinaceae archaeon]
MFQKMFTNSLKYHKTKCEDLRGFNRLNDRIYERHLGIAGFDPSKYSDLKVLMVGAGGLGGEIGEGLVRKGIGEILFVDGDTVSLSNLNRQLFNKRDLSKNKAVQIVKNLKKLGFMGTTLIGYPLFLQEYLESYSYKPDIVICGVDNDEARVSASSFGLKHNIPVIFTAVSRDANQGYTFIQKAGEACFGCVFPDAINNTKSPCPNTPAMKDILKIVGGMVLFAIDSILMDRKCNWNYRMFYLAGFMPDLKTVKECNPDCQLCSKKVNDNNAVK